MSDMEDLKKLLEELKKEIEALKYRRMFQQDYMPQSVKMSTMGEPNAYIRSGLAVDKPDGAEVTNGTSLYFETDTFKLKIYTGSAWKEIQLT